MSASESPGRPSSETRGAKVGVPGALASSSDAVEAKEATEKADVLRDEPELRGRMSREWRREPRGARAER